MPKGYFFNPSVFSPLPANAYVLRTNPRQYSCITGPTFFDLDASLVENFHITERIQGQLKMTAYNATNKLNLGDPSTRFLPPTSVKLCTKALPRANSPDKQATYGNQAGRQVELD